MSQFTAKGLNPKTGRPIRILTGYDIVPGFKPGFFFMVFLMPDDPDYNNEDENCILNEGLLDGLTKEELEKLFTEWSVTFPQAIHEKLWIEKQ